MKVSFEPRHRCNEDTTKGRAVTTDGTNFDWRTGLLWDIPFQINLCASIEFGLRQIRKPWAQTSEQDAAGKGHINLEVKPLPVTKQVRSSRNKSQ